MSEEIIIGLSVFLVTGIAWLTRELQWRRRSNNRNSITEDRVKRYIAEHERDCNLRESLLELQRELGKGIRGVHERLDRIANRKGNI